MGVFLPSRVQVWLKSVWVPSVNVWKPVPSASITHIWVIHFTVSGWYFKRRKNTSMSPVLDHDGLKSW